jgi:hypothetical protein
VIGPYRERVTAQSLIGVEATRGELQEEAPGVVDVFAALDRQFFWADRVMLAVEDGEQVLSGVIVPERT